jgi:hypothetical protein
MLSWIQTDIFVLYCSNIDIKYKCYDISVLAFDQVYLTTVLDPAFAHCFCTLLLQLGVMGIGNIDPLFKKMSK